MVNVLTVFISVCCFEVSGVVVAKGYHLPH
jgi:hypothetical protein